MRHSPWDNQKGRNYSEKGRTPSPLDSMLFNVMNQNPLKSSPELGPRFGKLDGALYHRYLCQMLWAEPLWHMPDGIWNSVQFPRMQLASELILRAFYGPQEPALLVCMGGRTECKELISPSTHPSNRVGG